MHFLLIIAIVAVIQAAFGANQASFDSEIVSRVEQKQNNRETFHQASKLELPGRKKVALKVVLKIL